MVYFGMAVLGGGSVVQQVACTALDAEFPGTKKVNLCILIGLYLLQKVKDHLPSN